MVPNCHIDNEIPTCVALFSSFYSLLPCSLRRWDGYHHDSTASFQSTKPKISSNDSFPPLATVSSTHCVACSHLISSSTYSIPLALVSTPWLACAGSAWDLLCPNLSSASSLVKIPDRSLCKLEYSGDPKSFSRWTTTAPFAAVVAAQRNSRHALSSLPVSTIYADLTFFLSGPLMMMMFEGESFSVNKYSICRRTEFIPVSVPRRIFGLFCAEIDKRRNIWFELKNSR